MHFKLATFSVKRGYILNTFNLYKNLLVYVAVMSSDHFTTNKTFKIHFQIIKKKIVTVHYISKSSELTVNKLDTKNIQTPSSFII